MPCIQKAWH